MSTPTRFNDTPAATAFLLAGKARLTLVSMKTGTRYTYEIKRAAHERDGRRPWFVSVLVGPDNTADYQYLAALQDRTRSLESLESRFWRRRGERGPDRRFEAFRFFLRCLDAGELPDSLEVWHEGKCGRCGRVLTTPQSLMIGIGPECLEKGGR